jgi:uncharacterized protein
VEDAEAAYGRKDYGVAIQLLRPLAEQGIAHAQYDLGVMSQMGQGVPQDYSEAVKWFRKAADQGDANAESFLGLMYLRWRAVQKDFIEAYKWVSLAAAHTQDTNLANTSVKTRDALAAEMTPDQIAEAQRLARDWKPSR